MQLTEEELEEGRGYVRRGDLRGLDDWVEQRRIPIDRDVLRRTMLRCIVYDNDRALKLFDAAFVGEDPELDRLVTRVRTVLVMIVVLMLLLGAVGGTAYLFKLMF